MGAGDFGEVIARLVGVVYLRNKEWIGAHSEVVEIKRFHSRVLGKPLLDACLSGRESLVRQRYSDSSFGDAEVVVEPGVAEARFIYRG